MSEAAIDSRAGATVAFRPGVAFAILVALGCGVAMTWPQTANVWTTGAFGDTDDAMRMAQVRDLLTGQGWFDMAQHRLAPPEGSFMHWSRVVDVPLVALMKTFGLLLAPAQAEAATRLVFPLALLAGLYMAVAHVARLFGGRAVQIAAVGLAFATAPFLAQFVPGRIDHHAPQIVLLMLASGAVLDALDASRAKAMWVAASCIALSLAISLENLPFFVVLAAIPVVAWVVRGAQTAPALRIFALGLIVALPVCFVATVGPARWTNTACDAYSAAHLVAGFAGACALLGLGFIGDKLATPAPRLAAAVALGLVPLAALALVAPACFGDPFVGLDPLVRAIWLDHVAEVQKLLDLGATRPAAALMLGAPLALALVATLAAAAFSQGVRRARLLALGALIAVGFMTTFWAVRVFSSVAPLAAIGAAVAVVALAHRLAPAGPLRPLLATLFCLPFAPLSYAFALPGGAQDDGSRTAACLQPSAVAPLDAAPAGLVLAPIDEGSHLLAFTHHSVVAAPYHRNNAGNRLSIDVFMASPEEARKLAVASGADYLVACPLMQRTRIMAQRAPEGLAAALIAGRVPDWLEPMAIDAKPNAIYRILR
ncbi:MAG TPA: hypothetical protein PKA55_18330 [Rhodoblastus sp.]|nr:hypothetical protein [Rhodoblastus sp.]